MVIISRLAQAFAKAYSQSNGNGQSSTLYGLFLVYINDLDTGLINELLKFADNTKVFRKVTDGSDSESIQEDLNRLVNWADRWKMEFNVKKNVS